MALQRHHVKDTMKVTNFKTCAALIACVFLSAQVYALTISDPGVAGGFWAGGQVGDVTNVTAWGNYLLGLGANRTARVDASGDTNAATETYKTGLNNYNGALNGGTAISGSNNVAQYAWAMARYGDNRYVLYYVPHLGGNTIPLTSESIWTRESGLPYGLTRLTGYGGTPSVPAVPDGGATLMLLAAALGCLEAVRRFKKV
jgi:hypothetical protein